MVEEEEGSAKRRRPRMELLAHQVEHVARVVRTLRSYGAAIDSSDTGTGKTLCAIKAAQEMGVAAILVVCPPAVEEGWRKHLAAATTIAHRIFTYAQLSRTATSSGPFSFGEKEERQDVAFTARGTLRAAKVKLYAMELKPEVRSFIAQSRTLVVLDEMHHVKNFSTQAAQGAHLFAETARRAGGAVLHLSATPVDSLHHLEWLFKLLFAGQGEGGARAVAARWVASHAPPAVDMEKRVVDARTFMARLLAPLACPTVEAAVRRLGCSNGATGTFWRGLNEAAMTALVAHADNLSAFPGLRRRVNDILGAHRPGVPFAVALMSQVPLAVSLLEEDIMLAVDLLLYFLPALISRMDAPQYGVQNVDVNLFLEGADVGGEMAQRVTLPTYRSAVLEEAAPLVSPSGLVCLPEEWAERWRDEEWQLGRPLPVEAWRAAMEALPEEGPEREDAAAAYAMCKVCHDGGAEGEGEERLQRAIEMRKVPPLAATIRRLLTEDSGLRVVVMFNYLDPLHAFLEHCAFCTAVVTGDVEKQERLRRIRLFNHPASDVRVLACTIHVLSEGVNLHDTHGDKRRAAFIMACPSAIRTTQAQGRIFRVGVKSHAMNCVVYGGFSLGGAAEQRLMTRLAGRAGAINMMHATSSSAPPVVGDVYTVRSTRQLLEVYRALHAGEEVDDAATTIPYGVAGGIEWGSRWFKKEWAMRMWPAARRGVEGLREETEGEGEVTPEIIKWRLIRRAGLNGMAQRPSPSLPPCLSPLVQSLCSEEGEEEVRGMSLSSMLEGCEA